MTALYQDLGARVVAVEPIPYLAALIRRRFHATVEQAAVGATAGRLALRVGRVPNHSTLSAAYAERFADRLSDTTIDVEVVTLDQLVGRHGLPDFVKIDVEGFEADALRGLHSPVAAVCFEFQYDLPDVTAECLSSLGRLADYGFRFAENLLGGSTPLWPGPHDPPADATTLLARIRRTMASGSYGDIYATDESSGRSGGRGWPAAAE
jgi:FkbM family methyltransferase